MPGCAAIGCNNRSEKGFTMKCFPRNPKLRKIWTERVSRADWEPSNNSFLCHVHFEADQWTITQSGRIKLKKNAIPSIFTITSTRKSPRKRRKLANGEDEDLYIIEYLDDPLNLESSPTLRNTIYNSYTTGSASATRNRASRPRLLYPARRGLGMENREDAIVVSDETSEASTGETKRANGAMRDRRTSDRADYSGSGVKSEIKPEINDERELDEIEEKLRSICDGEPQSDEKASEKIDDRSASRKGNDDGGSSARLVPNSGNNQHSTKFQEKTAGRKRRSRLDTSQVPEKVRLVTRNGGRTEADERSEGSVRQEAPKDTRAYATFTIKLTGIDEDVTEIVEGLGTEPIFKYKSGNELSRGGNNVVTSVISVTDGCPVKLEKNEEEAAGEPAEMKETKRLAPPSEPIKKETSSPPRVSNGESWTKLSVESPEEDQDTMNRQQLKKKIIFQEQVVQSLTGQLNSLREGQSASNHINTRSQSKRQQKIAPKTCNGECRSESKERLANDFSLKIKESNESIKRLNKSLSAEKQNVKNAQFQIRQRDNRIKELNWKLNKASKYIERAEKNANNYRKKMMSLQSLLTKKTVELEMMEASRKAARVDKSENEDREPDASSESVVYRTVQDIFEESNHCDDDPIIDNPEDFMRQFAGSL